MITTAIIAWLVSGFSGWAWMKWNDWLAHPILRKDITLCTVAVGMLISPLGLILLLVAAISCERWPFGIKCPIVLIKAKKS